MFFGAIAVFEGCADGLGFMDKLPDDLGNKGMVVAYVRTEQLTDINRSYPLINNYLHIGHFNSGYVTVPLAAGEYTWQSLNQTTGGYNVYVPNIETIHVDIHKDYPVGIKFKIEPGKITNLGLIRINREEHVPGTEYTGALKIQRIDNTPDMANFLSEAKPALYSSLKDKHFIVAPGTYLDARALQDLRYETALNLMTSNWRERNRNAQFVMGPYGTLARIQTDPKGKIKLLLMDAQTTRDLSACTSIGTRAACMTSATKYFLVQGDKVVFGVVPDGIMANSIHALDSGKFVVIDESMNLHVSVDEGKSWQKQTDFLPRKVFVQDQYHMDILNAVGLERGVEGHYFYTLYQPKSGTRVLYSKSGSGVYSLVDLPKDTQFIQAVEENSTGLYVATSGTDWIVANGKMLSRLAGTMDWRSGNLGKMSCLKMTLAEPDALNVKIDCDGAAWQSSDGGSTWTALVSDAGAVMKASH
jgi:hypothetical protein